MKKAIWAAVLAAIVSIFAISCSKTSMNSSKLVGTWKLISSTVKYDNVSETETVTGDYTAQFIKGGGLITTQTSGSKTYTFYGTWNVIDDEIYVVFDGEVTIKHIDEINAKSMTLTHTESHAGKVYTVTQTLAKL